MMLGFSQGWEALGRGSASFHASRGFTLLELMIIMLIVGFSVSLVAPEMFHSYEKIKAYDEEKKLAALVEAVRLRSFFRKTPMTITFVEDTATIVDQKKQLRFNSLSFPKASLSFNRHGFSEDTTIIYHVSDQVRELHVEKQ